MLNARFVKANVSHMAQTFLKYGYQWPLGTDPLMLEFQMIRLANGQTKTPHYLAAHKLLWPEDEQHRWFVLGLKTIVENKVTVLLGCASCVAGETRILNPITGEQPTIQELYEKQIAPTVMTLEGAKPAGIPFIKGEADLFEVVMSDGNRFFATAEHRVLSARGFCHVSDLQTGQSLFSYAPVHPASTSELDPSTHAQGVPGSPKRVEGFPVGCHHEFHSDDEQLLLARAAAQSSSPSQDDVRTHKERVSFGSDDSEREAEHIRSCQQSDHLSNEGSFLSQRKPEILLLPHFHEEIFSHGDRQNQSFVQFQQGKILHCKDESPNPCLDGKHCFCGEPFLGTSRPSFSMRSWLKELSFSFPLPPLEGSFSKLEIWQEAFGFAPDSDCNNAMAESRESYPFRVSQSRVVSITKSHKAKFYDLNVPEVHHYFAEGAIHHNSSKTYIMAVHALIDFFCFPNTSLALVSSTDIRSLELKVWGRFKTLFNRARQNYPWLPGYPLDSKMTISPNDIDEENEVARTLNVGIACVPCVSGGRFIGMGKFQGAKPPHSPGKTDGLLKHYGDEAAVMQSSFLDAYTNWTVSPGFKGVMCGNPTDISDPLCVAAEPKGGWDAFVDTGKTQEWVSQWYDARVIAFDGRDTPNNDDPKKFYPYLVSAEWVESMKQTHGEDSWQFFQQAIGKPSRGMVSNRVITIGLCERNQAFEAPVWRDSTFTDIYALDPAFGGGDRCVGGKIRMGTSVDGKQIIEVGTPETLIIRLNSSMEPEEQIAEQVFRRMRDDNIPAENGFYDSFGRGTLGFAFAKLFGASCPVPVDSGARPTARPVRFDLFVDDGQGGKRLKRCDEHYSKFVTEAWFSTREAIESGQIRSLPRTVANEGQLRMF